MKKNSVWTVDYEKDTIKVENEPSIAKLFINNEVQDIHYGMNSHGRLTGKLSNGKDVKVVIGIDMFKIRCAIFVDNKLILED